MKIPNHEQCNVSIIGLGYVGLPLAIEFAKTNNEDFFINKTISRVVTGFDINKQRIKELKSGKDWSRGFSRLLDALANSFKMQPLKTVHKKPKTDDEWRTEKASSQKEINRILDKISKSGYESLNEKEKETLFKASKK